MNKQANFRQHSWLGVVFIFPQLFITLLFFFWPAIQALYQSLFQSDAFSLHWHFVGLKNFFDVFSSKAYLEAFFFTLIFSFLVTFLTLALGLSIAMLLQTINKGKRVYKILCLLPYAIAPAVAALLWRFMFSPAVGWLPFLLAKLNIDWNYMVYSGQARFLVIITSVWQQFSYNFLFFYAAIQALPNSLIEAAKIEGANAWQRFWHILFPLLSPTIFFLIVINLIYSFFDTFGIIQILTQGGPAQSTTTLVYKVYNDGFINMDYGLSAAQSVILLFLVSLLTVVQFHYLEKKVHY